MKNQMPRRLLVMCGGILLMGLGIALFKLSLMGNDPATAPPIAVSDRIPLSFAGTMLFVNGLWFVLELLFGRHYIGIGTFVNWLGLGYLTTAYTDLITAHWSIPEGFLPRLLIMCAGVLVLSLAASLYQTADLGISPYDSLSLMLSRRFPVPYFWCRIFTDSACTVGAFALGGIIGPGTLVCSLGLGPFISFFNVHVSQKLCGARKETG